VWRNVRDKLQVDKRSPDLAPSFSARIIAALDFPGALKLMRLLLASMIDFGSRLYATKIRFRGVGVDVGAAEPCHRKHVE
jgi:hypothetical protein